MTNGTPNRLLPITTAPKDGTKVDIWVTGSSGNLFRIPDCKWGKSHGEDLKDDPECWLEYRGDDLESWRLNWYGIYEGFTAHYWNDIPS